MLPTQMALEVTVVSPNASYLKFSVMIKDGRDGDCVLSDPYEVVLPVQACDKQRGKIMTIVN